jgi:hypothetical protein
MQHCETQQTCTRNQRQRNNISATSATLIHLYIEPRVPLSLVPNIERIAPVYNVLRRTGISDVRVYTTPQFSASFLPASVARLGEALISREAVWKQLHLNERLVKLRSTRALRHRSKLLASHPSQYSFQH